MNSIVDNLEALLADAHRTKGWVWVSEEQLWTTWTLAKFGMITTTISRVICHLQGIISGFGF